MNIRVNLLEKILFSIFIICLIASNVFGQKNEENADNKNPSMFFLPLGYDFIRLGEQSIHSLAAGAGFLIGEQDIPFTEVERRFFCLALYQPFFFREEPQNGVPQYLHQIDVLFDGRINRHQLLLIFKSAADKPIAGGLSTFQAGVGWGYELICQPQVSLILGGALTVSDFGLSLPGGAAWPVLPLPLIRFNIDTRWFVSSFEFLTGPNFSFTVAPKEKIRLTADMRMDYYRSINDLICEFTLWYRLFNDRHSLGDFAGIGIGFKNDSIDFTISDNKSNFELQQTSIFAVVDLSILTIQSGWIFDSRYLADGTQYGSPGRGWYISIQGMVPVFQKGRKH